MEEDQKLFDSCTQNFNRQIQMDEEKSEAQQKKWEMIEQQAKSNMQTLKLSE